MTTQSSSTVVSRLAVAASVAALSISARAADITWENKTGDWTQDELWNGGVAPGPEDIVSFKSGEMTITNAVEFGQEFHIGKQGAAVVTIGENAAITGGCYHVGRDPNGNGTMIVDGGSVKATGTSWWGSFNAGYLSWGTNARGLVQLKSGTIEANHVAIGRSATATGRLEISGGEFKAESSADFNIGHDNDNAHGEVVITDGKLLASGGGNLNVAAGKSSTGEVILEGGLVENSKGLRIGGASNAVGRVTVTGGAWTNTENSVNIGATTDGAGYLTVNGGEFFSGKKFRVGSTGIGHLTIGGTGVVIDGTSGDDYICFGGPDSVILLNEGGKLYLRSILRDNDANGTVEFNGGEMIKTVESGAYSWAGVGPMAIDENHTIKILAGGMIFNSNFKSTCQGSVLCADGCGGITKRGSGELDFNTKNNRSFKFSGPIYVEGGTLRFSGNAQLPEFIDVIRVAEGATLVITHNVTCRVLENNGTIQGGTVTVESDAATKVATKAVWTDAMGDGNVLNAKNYIVYDQNDRVMYEQTITVDTPVTAPYRSGIPSFDGFTDVTWVVEENVIAEFSNTPEVLKAAAAWYDPSDTRTLTTNEAGQVTAMMNKGNLKADIAQQVDLDLTQFETGKTASSLSTDGLNGRQSIYFDGTSGFKSKGYFPADFLPNGERTVFAVAQGDVNKMIMVTVAQGSKNSEEGKCVLLAHKESSENYGCAYKIGYKSGSDWKAGKASFNDVVSDTPYVFAGRTALGNGDERLVVSSAMSESGAKVGQLTPISFNMPAGEDETRFNLYYGAHEVNVGWTIKDNTVGYQGEVLIFTNALSDAEMDEVNEYLRSKWLRSDGPVMAEVANLVVDAEINLNCGMGTFAKLSGSGSFVNGTVVVTGDLVVTVNADQSVVVPTFDKLVLGPSARLVVNGARNLPTSGTINIIPFTSLEGEFSSVVGDRNTRVILRYLEDHVCARRDAGFSAVLR